MAYFRHFAVGELACVLLLSLYGHVLIRLINANSQFALPEPVEVSEPALPGRALVPFPQVVDWDETFYQLDMSGFQFTLGSDSPRPCDVLDQAIKRYWSIIFTGSNLASSADNSVEPELQPKKKKDKEANRYPWTRSKKQPKLQTVDGVAENIKTPSDASVLKALVVNVVSGICEKQPSLNMDESYNITFKDSIATISSVAVWGALRGLETFSQLVYNGTGPQSNQLFVRSARIQDWPRFKFRGILLDTSRHFLSKSFILKHLDLSAQNKFNVFHWHITDDGSFPYQSLVFPALSVKGAYSPNHVYTIKDVADIVEYARLRGIRVIPEFDTPGHSLSWGWALPGFLTKCAQQGYQGDFGPINPANAANYDVLVALFKEIFTVFPDKSVHLGGDEVDASCWLGNTDVQTWMNEQGFTSGVQVESYYISTLVSLLKQIRSDRDFIVWQEVFDNKDDITKDTVVNVWKDAPMDELVAVTKAGYPAILSSCWYLNYVNYGPDWEPFYKCDPHNFTGSDAQKKLVFGGSACLWGEFIDDTNGIPILWPRASVVAERLWSSGNLTNSTEFAARYDPHRCRLIKRGYPAGPSDVRFTSVWRGYCDDEWEAN